MKNVYSFLFAFVWLGVLGTSSIANAKPLVTEKQQVFVTFERLVKVHDVLLKGEYAIVHDSALMEQDKPCFFIYEVEKGQLGKLVTTFHCERITRPQVTELKISYQGNGQNTCTPIVSEIQFAGDAEGHRVSEKHHH